MSFVARYNLKDALKNKPLVQQVCFYARWSHRRPLKVYTPEEYEEMEKKSQTKDTENTLFDKYGGFTTSWERAKKEKEGITKPVDYKINAQKVKKPLVATNQKSKVGTTDMLETVIDRDGNFIYTKMKDNDSRVGSILVEIKSKKEKEKKDLILLEGKRLIKDALLCGCQLKYVLFSRKEEVEYLKPFLPKVGANLYKMPYREMQMWSDLSTNPGIMGIFKIPATEEYCPKNPLPLTVICDNVREPGNLGTILRICAAVGCSKVLLTKGCVNIWDTKVLRSAVGAHFKLRIEKNLDWKKIEESVGSDAHFFIADNKIVSDGIALLEDIPLVPYYDVDFNTCKHVVLVMGGETHGISKDSYELALKTNGARLNIPLSNDVDSLNVGAALGIIAFEIKKNFCK